MTAVRIEVTFADIADGRRCSTVGCAIALAAERALPGRALEIIYGAIQLVDAEVRLPDPALSFIRAFDSGCAVQPFAFEVEVP